MRGFYGRRRDQFTSENDDTANDALMRRLLSRWSDPLTDEEIAAAKTQGCAGCAWHAVRAVEGYVSLVCSRQPIQVLVSSGRHWCSEWRGEPTPAADVENEPQQTDRLEPAGTPAEGGEHAKDYQ